MDNNVILSMIYNITFLTKHVKTLLVLINKKIANHYNLNNVHISSSNNENGGLFIFFVKF